MFLGVLGTEVKLGLEAFRVLDLDGNTAKARYNGRIGLEAQISASKTRPPADFC